MHPRPVTLFALLLPLATSFAAVGYARPAAAIERSKTPELGRARELDGLGVRAFRDARYRDAILFFTEAYRLGAPSTELWNIARCRRAIDEPEEESIAIQQYLAQQDLSADERAEATKELAAIRRRASTVSIDSAPSGAAVSVDGRPLGGVTPLAVELAPGEHKVRVDKPGAGGFETNVEAKYGRAMVVFAQLDRQDTAGDVVTAGARGKPPVTPARDDRRFSVSLDGGYFVARLGAYSAPVAPAVHLAGRYVLTSSATALLRAGLRFGWTQDRWASGTLAEPSPTGCSVPRSFVANDLSVLAVVGGALRLGARARIGGEVGFGFDALSGSDAGGEVFTPTCTPSFGARVLGHVALDASYALGSAVRVVLSPVVFQAHPAFSGTRSAPIDTSGAWWRVGSTLGIEVNL